MPPEVRVAVAGAGFWSGYQTAAWRELPGVRVVAVWKDGRIGCDGGRGVRVMAAGSG